MPKRFYLGNVRALFTQGFTDEELRTLCYDEPVFRQVYEELESKTGKTEIIQRLIEHADRQEKLNVLLAWAKEHNPAAYKNHKPYEEVTTASTIPSDVLSKSQGAKYRSPKYDSEKLATLIELRKEAGLSQNEVAEFFGMKRWDSVGAWELGKSAPPSARRAYFFVYLLDRLGLRRNYEKFLEVWNNVMVEVWGWEPLSDKELRSSFPGRKNQPVLHEYIRLPLQRPPRAPYFTGREKELAQLLTDLQPGRVITLCGPGGIGKTALTSEAIWTLAPFNEPPQQFPDGIIFHSFYDQPEAILALESIARAFGEEPRPTPRDAAQRALAGRQALLVLDGAENADDLQAVLAVAGSCSVLITSRQRRYAISGCQDMNPLLLDEAVDLLQTWGRIKVADKTILERICNLVGRLPLAVRLAGSYIANYKQNVAEYLEWLETQPLVALDQGPHQRESVPLLLDRSVNQLSENGRKVLGVLGLLALVPFRREVVAQALGKPMNVIGRELGELLNYGLLRETEYHFEFSHALVHTYARQQGRVERKVTRRMVEYYISLLKKQSELGVEGYKQLDSERAHLMSLLTGCIEREDWWQVKDLAWTLGEHEGYLDLQGHWTERMTAIKAGLLAVRALRYRRDELNSRGDEERFLGKLGSVYLDLGQREQAIEYFQQALDIAREIEDQENEGVWLDNLGIAYNHLGQREQAIEYYQQALDIAREIRNLGGEEAGLNNLGVAYHQMGQIEQAIEYYQEGLIINQEIKDRHSEGILLSNLGSVYLNLGQKEQAIEYFQQALVIAKETGDLLGEAARLNNLGWAYQDLGHVEKAIGYYQPALAIAREIGDRDKEETNLNSLGIAYHDLKQDEKAIEYYQQALVIARATGNRLGEAIQLHNMGEAYKNRIDLPLAQQFLQQALSIFEELKSPYAEESRLLLAEFESDSM